MKITLNSSLIKKFKFLCSITTEKEIQFSYLLFNAKGSLVKISATNGKAFGSIVSEVSVSEEGSVCFSAKKFIEIIDKWHGDFILSGNEDKVELKLGKSKYKLNANSPKNFPVIGKSNDLEGIILPKSIIQECLTYGNRWHKNEYPSIMDCINIQINDYNLTSISTDRITLSCYRTACPGQKEFEINIPPHASELLGKFLDDSVNNITVKKSGGIYYLSKETNELFGFLEMTGQFPDVTKILMSTEEVEYSYKINTADFIKALERILKTADEKSRELSFSFSGKALTIKTATSVGEGEEELEIENLNETDINFCANGENIRDFSLSLADEKFILLTFNKNKSKINISNEDNSISYLAVPIVKNIVEVKKDEQ